MTSIKWLADLDHGDIIALSSALIALCALFIAVWNSIVTRRHQKLSVRPQLSIIFSALPEAPQLKIRIKNDGLGPALIESIEVYLDGTLFPITRAMHWYDLVQKLHKVPGEVFGYAMYHSESLRPGDTLILLEITNSEKLDAKALQAQAERLKIVVKYKSMYNKKFTETWCK